MMGAVDGFCERVGHIGDAAEFFPVDLGYSHEVDLLVADGEFGRDDLGEDDVMLDVEI